MLTTIKSLPASAFFVYNNAVYQASNIAVNNGYIGSSVKGSNAVIAIANSGYVNEYTEVVYVNEDTEVEHVVDTVLVTDINNEVTYVHLDSNGNIHNDNGPAIYNDAKDNMRWMKHGVLHNERGAAVVYTQFAKCEIDGEYYGHNVQYWLNGNVMLFEEYKAALGE